MLTRIVRYTLLALTVAMSICWGLSYLRSAILQYGTSNNLCQVVANRGTVLASLGPNQFAQLGLKFDHGSSRPIPMQLSPFDTPGFDYMTVSRQGSQSTVLIVRLEFWFLTGIAATALIASCYRPLRNRLRPKRDAGFEVETKQPEPVRE